MPAHKQSSTGKHVIPSKGGWKVRSVAASALTQSVAKGTSSAATKEAIKSNADRHREAMIRLANR